MRFFFNHKDVKGFPKIQIAIFVALCSIHLITFSPFHLTAQVSQGGLPASFNYNLAAGIPEINFPAPDIASLRNEDQVYEKMGYPERVGIAVKTGIDLMRDGRHEILPDGSQSWRLIIACKEALALGLYFDDFNLEPGYRLFIYDESRRYLLGAYTFFNNKEHRLFSTELIPAERLVIELNAGPGSASVVSCNISEISYVYKHLPDFLKNRGTSDDCEVNINCPEGANWQLQKHGVTRIYVKQGGGYFWCTGALLNNTLQNNEPYLLTADHCAPSASPDDMAQWIFYFNYEAPGCENPLVNPVPNSMTGAEKLANANTIGSDFLLLRLAENIPDNYEPYFNGWSIENIASPNGVTIHHPAGDIKKISSYSQQIQSSAWYSTPGTHWQVIWSETETNWGVTEGGSSGSPLYDNFGRIIGALTGGQAACEDNGSGTGPDQPDYYGKFSYSWDQNGNDPSQQLKYWLDPINAGVTTLPGKNAKLTAAFQASETFILTGTSVTFHNYSSGIPNFYQWTFEGGKPGTYAGSDSIEINYADAGRYNVRLVVSDGFDYDTLLLTDYIHVVGKVYPNPTKGIVHVFIEEDLPAQVHAEVYNIMGQKIYEKHIPEQSYPLISLDLSQLGAGTYTIRLEIKQRFIFARVIVLEP